MKCVFFLLTYLPYFFQTVTVNKQSFFLGLNNSYDDKADNVNLWKFKSVSAHWLSQDPGFRNWMPKIGKCNFFAVRYSKETIIKSDVNYKHIYLLRNSMIAEAL